MPIPVYIVARMGSQRLPGKHLLPLGTMPVIQHIVRRCENFDFQPHICCPVEDVKTFEEATSCIDIYGLTTPNVEELVIAASHHFEHECFHQLDGDDPFFDEWMVIDSYNAANFGVARVHPSYQCRWGSGRVGTTYNRHQAARGERNLSNMGLGHPWPQRLTLDYEEDYHLLQAVNRMCGGYMAPRKAIDDLFVHNPDLHKINWHLTEQWKERQRCELLLSCLSG